MAKPKTVKRSTRYRGVRQLENGKWAARYTDPEGRERENLTFTSELDAHRWRSGKVAEVVSGKHVDIEGTRLTVRRYVERWQGIQVHRKSTADQVDGHLRNHVLPRIGDKKLTAVKRSDIQALVKAIADKLAPSTVEVVYSYVSTIFRSAVEDRLIAESPCRKIQLPKKRHDEVVPPESAEVQALLAAVPDRYRALCILWAGTGLRRSEAYGLTVDRIDFLREQTIRVDRQLLAAKGGPVFAPLKTEASYRSIPMPTVVRDALAAHLAEFGEGPDRLVFTDDKGRAIRANRMNEVFVDAIERAKVRADITPHDLRHYYASLLIRRGASVKVVQKRLGHKTANETLDTYAHLWPDDNDQTRQAIDGELVGLFTADDKQAASDGG